MRTRRSVHSVLLLIVVATGLSLFMAIESKLGGDSPMQGSPVQAAGFRLAIDADTTNGICTTIDSYATVTAGQSYQIAVCVENLPQNVDAIDLDIYYDDTLNYVPDLPNEAPALDDNPDANAGATTFSSINLGSGWDCSGFGVGFPVGDQNPASGPGKGDTFITFDHFGGGSLYLAGKSLPLAVIQFQALDEGVDNFVFGDLDRLAWHGITFGLCDPESAKTIPCDGATVTILPMPTPTLTPTPSPSPTPTLSPMPTPSPTATFEPPLDTDGGGAPDFLELLVGGDPSSPDDDGTILGTDSDGDGCTNGEELAGAAAPAPGSTGAYDPLAPYDFFDVPVPANPDPISSGTANGTVGLGDVLAVLFYVGASDNGEPNMNGVDYDSLKNGDANGDTAVTELDEAGRQYDRTASAEPNPPFDAGPPNGVVNLSDVLAALAQVGLECVGPL
jgi:hypothetical protein